MATSHKAGNKMATSHKLSLRMLLMYSQRNVRAKAGNCALALFLCATVCMYLNFLSAQLGGLFSYFGCPSS